MLTDEEVVRRVQAGEGELFELIFERHFERIERYVRGARFGALAGGTPQIQRNLIARSLVGRGARPAAE